jgi:hypothetical protein
MKRAILANSILVFCSVALGVFAAEGIARLLGGYDRYISEVEDWNAANEQDKSLAQRQENFMRTGRFDDAAVDEVVYAIGDSFTMGQGLRDKSETWPGVLEKCLSGWGFNVAVVNLGRSGGDLISEHRFLERAIDVKKPKLVVHQTFLNDYFIHDVDDIQPFEGKRSSGPHARLDLQSHLQFYAQTALNAHVLSSSGFTSWMKKWGDPSLNHWERDFDDFSKLVNMVESRSIPMVSFLVPANSWIDDRYDFEQLHWAIMENAEKYEIPLVDLTNPLMSRLPLPATHYWTATFDAHPGRELHETYGQIMCDHIRRNELIDQ